MRNYLNFASLVISRHLLILPTLSFLIWPMFETGANRLFWQNLAWNYLDTLNKFWNRAQQPTFPLFKLKKHLNTSTNLNQSWIAKCPETPGYSYLLQKRKCFLHIQLMKHGFTIKYQKIPQKSRTWNLPTEWWNSTDIMTTDQN